MKIAKQWKRLRKLREAAQDLLDVLDDWSVDEQMEGTRYDDVVGKLKAEIAKTEVTA